jgi:alpha-tubulin suppressor-like RCC1 family protein
MTYDAPARRAQRPGGGSPGRGRRTVSPRSGPRHRSALLAVAGLGLAGLSLLLSNAYASAQPVHAAAPKVAVGQDQADHWGFFFGDNVGRDKDQTLSPTPINLPGQVAQLGTSNSTQYALLTDGTVWAWGQGTRGELGDGSLSNSFNTAVQVRFPPGVQIAFLATDAMPFDTGLAVDTNGNAWGWGDNKGGALCLGNDAQQLTPVRIPLTNVSLLAGADGHAVYDSNGTLFSCGSNLDGVLGSGGKESGGRPVQVAGLDGHQVVELVSAFENAGALMSNGDYFDWGYDGAGQLGNGTTGKNSSVPVQVHFPDFRGTVSQVAQGGSAANNGQTVVMLSDGSLFAWGNDSAAQLGDGRTNNEPSPVQIFAPRGVRYAILASGGQTSYAISTSGDVWAWGANGQGQIGDGSRHTQRQPVMVDGGASVISSTAGDVAVG